MILLGLNGSIEDKYTMKMSWRKGPYEVYYQALIGVNFLRSAHVETINGEERCGLLMK